jgi:hypothetical protein
MNAKSALIPQPLLPNLGEGEAISKTYLYQFPHNKRVIETDLS